VKPTLVETQDSRVSRGELGQRTGKIYEKADLAWVKKNLPAQKTTVIVRGFVREDLPADRGLTQEFLLADLKGAREYAKALVAQKIAVAAYVDVRALGWPHYHSGIEPRLCTIHTEVYELR